MPAMLARLYWAATCGDTLRSSTAACALIRSQSIGPGGERGRHRRGQLIGA